MRIVLTGMAFLFLTPPIALAQNTSEELRELARNPFADAIELPFQEQVVFNQGPYSRVANSLQIQPRFPLSISNDWVLIPRIVWSALVYQLDSTARIGGSAGLGDSTTSFFVTPARTGTLIWGLGPAILLPSATNNQLGSGKWGLGPTVAVAVEPKWGSVEVLVQNIWSVGGSSKRSPVNQLQLEPTFSYDLPRDWYLISQPMFAADWTQPATDRWLVPVGGGAGRSFHIGKQAIDSNITVYWNAVRPANQPSPRWQLSLQFILIFPKSPKPPK